MFKEVKESVNFERGMEPKESMKIGKNKDNLFAQPDFKSISFYDYIKDWVDPNLPEDADADMNILKAAAKMLGVPKEKVLVASDDQGALYSAQIDSLIEDREWTYDGETSIEKYDLIRSSTREIYIKVQETDEIIYVLGTIY